MSLKGKLQRFHSHLKAGLNPEERVPTEATADEGKLLQAKSKDPKQVGEDSDEQWQLGVDEVEREQIPFMEKWEQLGCQLFEFEGEYAIVREVRYPLSAQHGRYMLSELKDVVHAWNTQKKEHPLSTFNQEGQVDAEDLLFFDTETTGLGGGVGNTIFLLGYAQLKSDHIMVKQYFLPGPSAEVAFYNGFLRDVRELKNLVTYNGKAFDWPQVKTRHTLMRNNVPELPDFGHYDLLHAARRLWKNELPSCRLPIVEEEKLHFHRVGDTAGYLAPMLYFDYLKEGNPEIIEGILHHNEWDVLSLISLYIHMSSLILDNEKTPLAVEEQFEIGRWYERTGDTEQAIQCYESVIQCTSQTIYIEAKHRLAIMYKKQKNHVQARTLWEECLQDLNQKTQLEVAAQHPFKVEIHIELAKIYEHREKDVDSALHYALKAWACRNSKQGRDYTKEEEQLKHRIERLRNKQYVTWED